MGISPLGWLHTLGSLPAIPLALYMLFKHGRIVPATPAGRAYFWFFVLGAVTVYPLAHQQVSLIIATVALIVLFLGYGIARWSPANSFWKYVETASLSISVFLLLVPTVSETLRRLPAGHPVVTDLKDPLLLGAQGALFLVLLIGVPLQLRALARRRTMPAVASS
jgi:hypothetical protein